MKTSTLVSILILVLAVMIIAGSCVTDKMAYISKDYEIYGTWANPEGNDHPGFYGYPKIVFHPHGQIDYYPNTESTKSNVHGEFVITNKWTDSNGIVSYTFISRIDYDPDSLYYELYKISNSGKTLEQAWAMRDYPTEIDPNHPEYHIYYRQ